MRDQTATPYQNRLLSQLEPADQAALQPLLGLVTMEREQVLEYPNQAVEFVYFPESGIASVIATDGHDHRIEAGPFGREGMSGLPILLGTRSSPHETCVQIPGVAHRISSEDLARLLGERPTIHALFLRYVHAFSIQTAHTLIASAASLVETRLARWILMLHDRVDGDELAVTHEFMALMLGVRRPGVTVALHILEGEGLVRSKRGLLTMRDRAGLEAKCRGLYGVPEREYERLIGVSGRVG